MADYIVGEGQSFEFTYSGKYKEEVERIRKKYLQPKETKMDQLIKLDKSAERPGKIVSIATGSIGTFLLGIGMCCTMLWFEKMWIFSLGIITGIIGIVLISAAYPLNKKITQKEREKIAEQVIRLTDELSIENK